MTTDTRPRLPLNGKAIDLAQLAEEIGTALTASDEEIVVADPDANVTAEQVQAALDAHTPDPLYGLDEDSRQFQALRAKAKQVWAGDGTFTAAQVQKILAGLVLRATR